MTVIGFLCPASPAGYADILASFRRGLNEAGYVEGHNLAIEYRWAEDHFDRLPALATNLVRRQVAVIVVAGGTGTALAAKAATVTIPIVFLIGGDPVRAGLVASLGRPGGNVTGVTELTEVLIQKRLELARELVPNVAVIVVLLNPSNPNTGIRSIDVQSAARAMGQHIRVLHAGSEREFDAAFASLLEERIGALVVQNDTLFISARARLAALAAQYSVPALYELREFVAAGGLMSYGTRSDQYRQVAVYAGRILKGERPSDLPVLQPTKFDLVINLKTAKALGLPVPPTLLARADEVIE